MKVIIDTNVVISAAFKDRAPEEILVFIVSHPDFDWIASEEIIKEYIQVLRRKKFALPEVIIQKWDWLFQNVIQVIPVELKINFPRDQKDAIFMV